MTRFKTAWWIVLACVLLPIAASGAEPATAPEGAPRASKSVAAKAPQSQPEKKPMRSRGVARDSMDSRSERGESWLGVQLAPVPAALAAHLKLDDKGVMVRNVFEDSPADKAGMDRYDVIVAVDGKELDRGMSMLSKLIRSGKPGDEVSLKIYQRGQLNAKVITLGEAPDRFAQLSLKYEDESSFAHGQLYGMYGSDSHPWLNEEMLDDLDELPPLPRYEQYHHGQGYPKNWDRQKKGIEDYEEDIDRYQDSVRDYMRKYQDRLERPGPPPSSFRRYERGEMYPPESFDRPRYQQPGPPPAPLPPSDDQPMPEAQFDVRSDGSITAHVQDGPTELNMTFSDEQTFKQKAPRLYEQYRETVDRVK